MQEPKATVAGPDAPQKKRVGRPPGSKRTTTDRDLIEKLAKRIDELEAERASSPGTPIELAKLEVVDSPETAKIPPGTLIKVGETTDGTPIYRKKPWTKGDFDKSDRVTFFAPWACPVTINGVTWDITVGENTVPSGFKDAYRERMAIQHADYSAMFPSPSPDTIHRMNEQARKTGQRVFSGLYHLGTGLYVHTPEAEDEAPAAKA